MVIVFVIDNYTHQSNGTTITTRRFIEALRKRGHTIRILSTGEGKDIYTLKERYIPFVTKVARKQDVVFSKPHKATIKKALEGADFIHFVNAFKTSRVVHSMAKKMHIPMTASFHIQPENITYGANLNQFGFINNYIYRRFRKFYGKFTHVHAPSEFIAGELKKHHYPTTIRVISNGVSEDFFKAQVIEDQDYFHIISTGRYAKEKNHILLLKAINQSKYKSQIKLTLAGHGPLKKKLEAFVKKHHLKVEFGFFTTEALIAQLEKASLYVHPAKIEIEGIACLESIAVGLVPLIAKSSLSATKQLALTSNNLFKSNDVNDLVQKIEYWIEHPKEKKELQEKYRAYAQKFKLSYSIDRFEEMMQDAIREVRRQKLSETVKGRAFQKSLIHSPVKRTLSALTYYLIALPLLYIYMKFILNVKYKSRNHFKLVNGGAVVISNHVHILDAAMNSLAAFPKRPIMTAQKENFEKPVAGFFVHLLGAVPIPNNMLETQVFFSTLSHKARNGRFVHMYPEGELVDQDQTIRSFKKGAFKLAIESGVPIIPVRISFKSAKFFLWQRNGIVLNVGEPLYPDLTIPSKEALKKLQEATISRMHILE